MNSPDALTGERRRGRTVETASRPSRLALSNWPVSTRLAVLFVLASVTGLVFGGLRVASAINSSQVYSRTAQLAVLAQHTTSLAQALANERDVSAGVAAYQVLASDAQANKAGAGVTGPITKGLAAGDKSLNAAEQVTNNEAAQTLSLVTQVDAAFPANVQTSAAEVVTEINSIPGLRTQQSQQSTPAIVIATYSASIANLFSLNDEIAAGSSDPQLADDTRALGALSRAKDEASQQRAFLYAALIEVSVNDAGGKHGAAPSNDIGLESLSSSGAIGLGTLDTAFGEESDDLTEFSDVATADQSDAYQAAMAGLAAENVQLIEGGVSTYGDPRLTFEQVGNQTSSGFDQATVANVWYSSMTSVITQLRQIETQVVSGIVDHSQAAEHDATDSAALTAAVTAAAVLLVLLATALVGRTLVNPLRRLRADALEIAEKRLPARVEAAATATDPAELTAAVEPVGVQSTDEIGQVARAFDRVHAEAVRLAGNEAQLRGSLSAMFISLSRRSVPLIDRMSRTIDAMEQGEDDPDQLANLFAIDHLVTRMRRNSENLLVLAGEEPVRKWTESVPLADVTRAAVAEIQQYNRVALADQPGITVSGQAAADVVHLLAELIENATLFSPQQAQVTVGVTELTTGGVLVEVRDEGIGVSPAKLADMNWRLDHPPALDVSISRHMGLYAVAHLAARHGIRIKLRPGDPQGLSALVWLPSTLARQEQAVAGGQSGGRGTAGRRAAAGSRTASRTVTTYREVTGPLTAGSRPAVSGPAAAEPVLVRSGGEGGGGRHRGNLPSESESAEQPRLSGPGRGSHAARPTTAWFTAKRPSGAPSRSSEELAAGWQPSPAGGPPSWPSQPPAPGSGPADQGSGQPDPADQAVVSQTSAGLPRRVPRTSAHPGSGAPDFGWPGQSPANPANPAGPSAAELSAVGAGAPLLGAPAGEMAVAPARPYVDSDHYGTASYDTTSRGAPHQAPQERLPSRRRSPDAIRSRLSGFQLGSRDAAHAVPSPHRAPSAEEENSR